MGRETRFKRADLGFGFCDQLFAVRDPAKQSVELLRLLGRKFKLLADAERLAGRIRPAFRRLRFLVDERIYSGGEKADRDRDIVALDRPAAGRANRPLFLSTKA